MFLPDLASLATLRTVRYFMVPKYSILDLSTVGYLCMYTLQCIHTYKGAEMQRGKEAETQRGIGAERQRGRFSERESVTANTL